MRLDRRGAQPEPFRDAAVGEPLRHEREHRALMLGQQAPILRLIWETALRTGDRTLRHRVVHTLARISQGGIHDHLGGGDPVQCVDDLGRVRHTVLEQVAAVPLLPFDQVEA